MRDAVSIVMFDVPVDTPEQRRLASRFRSSLRRQGYSMLQKSIYIKLLRNIDTLPTEEKALHRIAPPEGTVQMLAMPVRYFVNMKAITGEPLDIDRWTAPIMEFD